MKKVIHLKLCDNILTDVIMLSLQKVGWLEVVLRTMPGYGHHVITAEQMPRCSYLVDFFLKIIVLHILTVTESWQSEQSL